MEASETIIKAFSFTFVVYEKGDLLSLIYALSALLPIFIVVAIATVVFVNREYQSLFLLSGIFVNELLNDFLKHSFAQDRPLNIYVAKFRNVDPSTPALVEHFGMPSSHSQFMFFFACTFLCWFRIRTDLWRTLTQLVAFSLAALVAYSRIAMHYHTPTQVLVGVSVGLAMGTIWKYFTNLILVPRLVPILNSFSFLTEFLSFHSNESIESTVEFHKNSVQSTNKLKTH